MAKANPVNTPKAEAEAPKVDPRRPVLEPETTPTKPKEVVKVGETTFEHY